MTEPGNRDATVLKPLAPVVGALKLKISLLVDSGLHFIFCAEDARLTEG